LMLHLEARGTALQRQKLQCYQVVREQRLGR
jgi:hypothetical protein